MDVDDSYILLTYQGQSHLVERPSSHVAARTRAMSEFDLPTGATLSFAVDWKGRRAKIGKDSFAIVGRVDELFVMCDKHPRERHQPSNMTVFVKQLTGATLTLSVESTDTIDLLKYRLQDETGMCPVDMRLIYAGRQLADGRTVSDCRFQDGCTIHLVTALRGGKPVIYLQPPHDLADVTVRLGLVQEWDFSAVYPNVTPKSAGNRSTIEWNVTAKTSGELTERATGLQLSYLFWEAETISHRPPTPDYEEVGFPVFHPSSPCITPINSVALPFTPFLKYLDRTLTSLGLHVSARNDFITFWLPHFARIHGSGQDIAFRFLPQIEYEHAAQLEVVPVPDVITRVFLLFGAIHSTDTAWAGAYQRVGEFDWKKIMGVCDEAWDESKFRVLEWGGMDVGQL